MKTESFQVEGMTCDHCVRNLQAELKALPGILELQVSIGAVRATYDEKAVSHDAIIARIRDAGYRTG